MSREAKQSLMPGEFSMPTGDIVADLKRLNQEWDQFDKEFKRVSALQEQYANDPVYLKGVNPPDKSIVETRRFVDLNALGKFDAIMITAREGHEQAFRYIGALSNRRGKPRALSEFMRDVVVEAPTTRIYSTFPASEEEVKKALNLIEDPTRLQFFPGVIVNLAATFGEEFWPGLAMQLGGVVFKPKQKVRGRIGVWEELDGDGEGRFRFFRKLPSIHKTEPVVEQITPPSRKSPQPPVSEKVEQVEGEDKKPKAVKKQNEQVKKTILEPGVYKFKPREREWHGEIIAEVEKVDEPDISFEDIGGLAGVKEDLRLLIAGLRNPEIYARRGTRPPRGVLLYGEPGTGKTMLAKAIAHEAGIPFFSISFTDIASRWVHHSAENLKGMFNTLDQIQGRKMVFIDEFDNVAVTREEDPPTPGGGSSMKANEILNPLLEYMDGFRSTYETVFIAATNRRDTIDPAMLRPGRFDRHYHIPHPKGEELKEIFQVQMANSQKGATIELFANDLDLDRVTRVATQYKYTGADTAEIIRRVLENQVRAELKGEEPSAVTTEELTREITQYERNKKSTRMGFRPFN